jgi:hypothetical protein
MQYLKTILPWEQGLSPIDPPQPSTPPVPELADGTKKWLTVAGTAAGTAGVGFKGMHDADRVTANVDDWMRSTQAAPLRQPGSAMSDSVRAAETYAATGRKAIQSKILGLPIPYMALQGATGVDSLLAHGEAPQSVLAKYWQAAQKPLHQYREGLALNDSYLLPQFLQKLFRLPGNDGDAWRRMQEGAKAELPNAKRHLHYWKYFSPKFSDGDLRDYALFDDVKKLFSPETQAMLKAPDRSLTQILAELKRIGHPDYYPMMHQLKNQHKILGGLGEAAGGLAHTYAGITSKVTPAVAKAFKGLGVAGAAAVPLALFYAARAQREGALKSASQSREPGLLDLGAGVAGIGAAASGAQELLSPFRVGTTFSGATDVHGAGHSTPGLTIDAILRKLQKESPEFAKMEVELPIRNAAGAVDPKFFGRKYHALFDTGMGSTGNFDWKNVNPNAFIPDQGLLVAPPKPPRVAFGGFTGYSTDLGSAGNPARSFRYSIQSPLRRVAQLLGVKDNYITWGDPAFEFKDDPWYGKYVKDRMRILRSGSMGLPTMSAAAQEGIQSANALGRNNLLADFAKTLDPSDPNRKLLENIGDKKLLAVTGSGRGDYVAHRVAELQKIIKRQGLGDKVQVLGALGSSAAKGNPVAQRLLKDPSVLAFERLPQQFYTGIPAVADMHWASSGTSALMEALSGKSPAAYIPNALAMQSRELMPYLAKPQRYDLFRAIRAGDEHWMHHILNNVNTKTDLRPQHLGDTPEAAKLQEWWAKARSVYLDNWNRGNKEMAFQQAGVHRGQTAQGVLDQLLKSTPEDAAVAARRGGRFMASTAPAQEAMTGHIRDVLRRQMKWKNFSGIGRLGAGASLLAAATLPFLSKGKGVAAAPVPPPQDPQGMAGLLQRLTAKHASANLPEMNAISRFHIAGILVKHASGFENGDIPGGGVGMPTMEGAASKGRALLGALKNNKLKVLLAALGVTGVGAGGIALANRGTPAVPPAPAPTPETPAAAQQTMSPETMKMISLALPSLAGAGIGGVGSLLGGGNPLRGAATGVGTGLGFTAGGMGGSALASGMGVEDPTMRALISLGGAGIGAYAGNRIAGSLVGNKRRYEDDLT